MLSFLLTVLGIVAFAYLIACIAILFYQNHLIFFPTANLETTPAAYNLFYRDVWIPVPAGFNKTESLHGWWIPAAEMETGVVLHLHGNGFNIGANLSQALCFHQLGLSVLLIDYRGYGRSPGKFPTESSVYADANAAWNYLVNEKRILPRQILLYGHSLGGAIAIHLATQHAEAAGLIVQSSFTSMRAMVTQLGHFWLFPIDLLLTQKFDSIHKVTSLTRPVLFTHGTADRTIPAAMSQQLFAATPEPKQVFLVADADHNDVAEVGGIEYTHTLRKFIDQIFSNLPYRQN